MINTIFRLFRISMIIASLSVLAFAQMFENKINDYVFTSHFTDLKKECKTGQEEANTPTTAFTYCPGLPFYGVSYLHNSNSLEFYLSTYIDEGMKSVKLQSIANANQNQKIEWRLANGRPFAVIMKIFESKTQNRAGADKSKGEKVLVKNLDGPIELNAEFTGKDAFAKARDYADKMYAGLQVIPERSLDIAENRTGGQVFSSYYTNFFTDCITEDSEDGEHVGTTCDGPGKYNLYYHDTASSLVFRAVKKGEDKDTSFGMTSFNYPNDNYLFEWRLANGKPFAVIMRYLDYEDGKSADPAKLKTRKVIVKGLDGHEKIEGDFSGDNSLQQARDFADKEYSLTIIPAKRIEIPDGQKEIVIEDVLVKGDEKIKFVIKGKERHRLTVSITTLSYDGEEGPVMYGTVTAPSGESDGQPGGTIFDSVISDGDYEIMVAQNKAKSGATNVRFKVTILMEPIYE